MDEFSTVDDIAALLKVHPQTVRNWIDDGRLEAVRVGARRVRVRQSALDDFLESGRRQRPRKEPVTVIEYVETAGGVQYRRAIGPFRSHSAAETWSEAEPKTDGKLTLRRVVIPIAAP